jgi:hypothetical protein
VSGRGIANLASPIRRFRVDLWPAALRCGFEALTDSQKEDLRRTRRLRAAAKRYPDVIDAEAAKALANRLDPRCTGGDAPKSVASSVYMRQQRIKISGALWCLVKEGGV